MPEKETPSIKPVVASIRLTGELAMAMRGVAQKFDVTSTEIVETILESLQRGEGIAKAYAEAKTDELSLHAEA